MEALGQARSLLRQRWDRDRHFPQGTFGEPAWELLLALYIGRIENRLLSTTTACEEAGLTRAVGEASLRTLESVGLVIRHPAGDSLADRVRLSDEGSERMTMLLLAHETYSMTAVNFSDSCWL